VLSASLSTPMQGPAGASREVVGAWRAPVSPRV
jgi:hypothetical protein